MYRKPLLTIHCSDPSQLPSGTVLVPVRQRRSTQTRPVYRGGRAHEGRIESIPRVGTPRNASSTNVDAAHCLPVEYARPSRRNCNRRARERTRKRDEQGRRRECVRVCVCVSASEDSNPSSLRLTANRSSLLHPRQVATHCVFSPWISRSQPNR